ncbi:putative cytokinetic ring protein SteA [Angustibacter luteus]|uniref:Cytokinetic ring protein SteA n=1 Tax=Angustibacter luteus TaxID=658456 RepID=A0ABW1J962_9ACTN
MRLPSIRPRTHAPSVAGVVGVAKVDSRTKNLTKRLEPGDVAVIDHLDIDTVAAEALVARRPVAVVNAAASTSGRYPNLGPEILLEAGITLVDGVGRDVMVAVAEGDRVRVHGGDIYIRDDLVASGTQQTDETVAAAMAEARAGLAVQMEAFAANTMEFLRRERDLLLDGVGVPEITTDLDGRHVLVVVRGYHYKEDLQTLRHYVREYKPVIIGVDGGADAVLDAGLKLHLIVGDMDSVSDKALTCGAEVVVHAYRDGRAPGLERVQALGIEPVVFPATGTSEDVAMLLADDKGAELIVAVGTHATLVEFLDKGRSGMASTFLTRLRIGGKLIDAKGVSRLYRSRISSWQVLLLLICGLFALFVAMSVTPAGQAMLAVGHAQWDDLTSWLRGTFT